MTLLCHLCWTEADAVTYLEEGRKKKQVCDYCMRKLRREQGLHHSQMPRLVERH